MRAVGGVVKQVVTAGNCRFILLGERWDSVRILPLEISLLKLESADVSTHLRAGRRQLLPPFPASKSCVCSEVWGVGRPPGNIC